MRLEGAARVARLDQERAEVDSCIDGLIADVQEVLHDHDPNEVMVALVESFADAEEDTARLVAAGCLLRLAQCP
jgi:hypothetical protein